MKLRLAATVALVLSGCGPQISSQPGIQTAKPGSTVTVGGVELHMVTATLATASSAPTDFVATPHGYYHQSCVYSVDATTDATTLRNTPCAYPRVLIVGNAPGVADGWIEDASYTAPKPAVKMTSSFVVPSVPSSSASQLDYFFPGMEPADGSIILQPVLAWGSNPAGGGAYFSLASWSCGPSCVHGNLVEAAVGDKVSGTITGSSCTAAGSCDWKIITKDSTNGLSSTLTTTGDTEAYVWLFSGVLEAYGVSACDQYPKAGKLEFSTVKFYDSTNAMIKPTWATQTLDSSLGCNYAIKSTEETATLSFGPAANPSSSADLGVGGVDLAGGTQDLATVSSTCTYACTDYGFAAGQCYSDWQCGNDGCLTQVTTCP
jgi:hypothetical protein